MASDSGNQPTYRQYSRDHGWSWPPHGFQFIAWGFTAFFVVLFYTTVAPGFLLVPRIVLYVVNSLLFLVFIVCQFTATLINPADGAVLERNRQGKMAVTMLDRSKHKHAIEEQFCHLCQVRVGMGSKHCSSCNKCVENFDHHCKWLNNCVGSRNYRWFFATVATACVGCLVLFSQCLSQFIAYFTDRNNGHYLQFFRDFLDAQTTLAPVTTMTQALSSPGGGASANLTSAVIVQQLSNPADATTVQYTSPGLTTAVLQVFYTACPDLVWLIVIGATAFLALLAVALLAHLLFFHVYLLCRGLTTYDYIVQERERAEKEAREKDVEMQEAEGLETGKKSSRRNKVVPDLPSSELNGGPPQRSSAFYENGGILREHQRIQQEAAGMETFPQASEGNYTVRSEGNTSVTCTPLAYRVDLSDHSHPRAENFSAISDSDIENDEPLEEYTKIPSVKEEIYSKPKKRRKKQAELAISKEDNTETNQQGVVASGQPFTSEGNSPAVVRKKKKRKKPADATPVSTDVPSSPNENSERSTPHSLNAISQDVEVKTSEHAEHLKEIPVSQLGSPKAWAPSSPVVQSPGSLRHSVMDRGPTKPYSPRGYKAREISLTKKGTAHNPLPAFSMSAAQDSQQGETDLGECLQEIPVGYTKHGNGYGTGPRPHRQGMYPGLSAQHLLATQQYSNAGPQYSLSVGTQNYYTPRKSYEELYLTSARTDDDVASSYRSTGPLWDQPLEYGPHYNAYVRPKPPRHAAVPPLDLVAFQQSHEGPSSSQRLRLGQQYAEQQSQL